MEEKDVEWYEMGIGKKICRDKNGTKVSEKGSGDKIDGGGSDRCRKRWFI